MTSTPKNTSGPHHNTPAQDNTAHTKDKTNQSELRENSHDAWDAAFESDDPTVVLSPKDVPVDDISEEKTRPLSAADQQKYLEESSSSANAQMKTDAGTAKDRSRNGDSSFGWLEDSDESASSDSVDQLRPAVPSSMVTYSTEALPPLPEHPTTPRENGDSNTIVAVSAPSPAQNYFIEDGEDTDEHAPILTAATAFELQKARYGRLQVIPGLMGWFAAMGVLQFLLWVTATVVEANHGSPYDSMAPIVRGLFSGNDALALWQGIGTGAAYLVAYCIGGYVAGRMARFSSAKQGISVWIWQVMIMFAASLLTYFTPQVFQGGSANLSVQWYMQHGTASAILSVALVLCITFIAAVLGGLMGGLYHRRVERYAQNYVDQEL